MVSDYTLRGKCKEMAENAVKERPDEYTLVRGFYYEPWWSREEEHWWCERKDGSIYDPTAAQFPSGGNPDFYRKHIGIFECSQCGIEKHESEMIHEGRFHLCSGDCYCKLVGIS